MPHRSTAAEPLNHAGNTAAGGSGHQAPEDLVPLSSIQTTDLPGGGEGVRSLDVLRQAHDPNSCPICDRKVSLQEGRTEAPQLSEWAGHPA